MRIALLSYRTKEHSGGQGVYVRQLSSGLAELGHHVEVFSGPPYPENLADQVRLTKIPGLDLYREPDPFRIPRLREFRDPIDVLEFALSRTGAFPEPLTFSMRVTRLMRHRAGEFDVVHDNQCLGSGLLELVDHGVPVVATIHHPITKDRQLELAAAETLRRKLSLTRWYSFVRMQARVARRIPTLIGVSRVSVNDTIHDFRLREDQFQVVPLGADVTVFRPTAAPRRVPGRIVCVASADNPLKGVDLLLDAVAKLRTERHVELHLVCKLSPDSAIMRQITDLGIRDIVHLRHDLTEAELASALASAEVAAVPSRYEGFSLPTVEALACGTPVVASAAGALPEVLGADGAQGVLVTPDDVEALTAALASLLDDPQRRAAMGAAARKRAVETFSWRSVAARTVEAYEVAGALAAQRRAQLRTGKGRHADR